MKKGFKGGGGVCGCNVIMLPSHIVYLYKTPVEAIRFASKTGCIQ